MLAASLDADLVKDYSFLERLKQRVVEQDTYVPPWSPRANRYTNPHT